MNERLQMRSRAALLVCVVPILFLVPTNSALRSSSRIHAQAKESPATGSKTAGNEDTPAKSGDLGTTLINVLPSLITALAALFAAWTTYNAVEKLKKDRQTLEYHLKEILSDPNSETWFRMLTILQTDEMRTKLRTIVAIDQDIPRLRDGLRGALSADPSSKPTWEHIFDYLSHQGSKSFAEAIIKGLKSQEDFRSSLAKGILKDTVDALSLDPDLLALLGKRLADPMVAARIEHRGPLPSAADEGQIRHDVLKPLVRGPSSDG